MAEGAPKPWPLGKKETVQLTSFLGWKNNLLYILKASKDNKEFLKNGAEWKAVSDGTANRGLVDDTTGDETKAVDKVQNLELMLGQIANYCPMIDRNLIIEESTCLDDVWELIKEHYGFQSTGGQFLELLDFRLETDECKQDLYQCI